MIIATYATYEEMHKRKSTLTELVALLKLFSRESVLYVCATVGMILKLWQRGGWEKNQYDLLLSTCFDPLRGAWYRHSARTEEPEIVFHRRQLLLLIKLAVEHCPEKGLDFLRGHPWVLGTIFLMANDHFHHGLYPFPEHEKADDREKIARVLTELVSVTEYGGFRIENLITRSHLMMTKYAEGLNSHPDYINIAREYENLSQISLQDYEALTFGLFTRCGMVTQSALQANAWLAAINEANFYQTAIPRPTIAKFLSEFTDTPAEANAQITDARAKGREYGANDFTVFRKRPLIREPYGALPTDVMFVAEKFATGPYWRINDQSREIGNKLRRFWGAVFESYVNDAIAEAAKRSGAVFVANPRSASDESVQICDGLLLEKDALIVMEYKSSMFSARGKYGGNHVLLRDEIATKLVRDDAEKRKKGVEQLADAVKLLCTDTAAQVVRGLDLRRVRRVYPLLITLDDLGGTLLLTRLLNTYYSELIDRESFKNVAILPLFCTDVESLEVILPFVDLLPITGFLQNWLEKDQKLIATLLAFMPDGLPARRNEMLDREWKALHDELAGRLFPEEHEAQKASVVQA